MTRSVTEIDTTALESVLAAELDERVAGIEVIGDGVNLLLSISIEGGGRPYVLRRANKLRNTALFNDPKTEYQVLEGLQPTAIPTPEPVLFVEDESIIGDTFFLTTHLDGDSIPWGEALPKRFRNPAARERIGTRLIETLAEIHSLDVDPFEGVCHRKTALDQVDQAAARLDVATSVTGQAVPRLRSVENWLRDNVPSDAETTLVHGDYRPGNVLIAGTDTPGISGVLDWETALLGDPLTELGYFLLDWRDADDPVLPLDDFEARYSDSAMQGVREINEQGHSPFTPKPGSPTRRELVARYEDLTGISFEHDRFYRAHAAFMLATVWADLHRVQVEAGAESGWDPSIDYMGLVAERIIDGEYPL